MSIEMYHELEWDGILYQKNDPIKFKTMKGKFRFKSWEKNLETNSSWVNVWHENKGYRAFRLTEIKAPKKDFKNKKKKGSVIKGVCPVHKQYGGIYKPRTDCKECWNFYNMNHE